MGRSEAMFEVAERRAADADVQIVGFSVAYVVEDQSELANLAVDGTVRRDGIGGQLLEHVMRAAAARGARELFLEVRVSNAAARALYEKRGFETIGRRVKYYVKPVEDALVLRRTLP
jgi:ribosomal-protein-alanine N-acetyltransferase